MVKMACHLSFFLNVPSNIAKEIRMGLLVHILVHKKIYDTSCASSDSEYCQITWLTQTSYEADGILFASTSKHSLNMLDPMIPTPDGEALRLLKLIWMVSELRN